jgi:hypothetical protein
VGPIIKDKLFGFLSYNAVRVTDLLKGRSPLYLPPGLTSDRSTAGLINAVNSSLPAGSAPFTGNFDPAAVNFLQAKLSNGQYLIPSVESNAAELLGNNQPEATLFGQPSFKADIASAIAFPLSTPSTSSM